MIMMMFQCFVKVLLNRWINNDGRCFEVVINDNEERDDHENDGGMRDDDTSLNKSDGGMRY